MPRLALGVAALALVLGAVWLWPTDARRIRTTLETAAAAVSAPAGERELERVARAASLAKTLAPDVVVETGPDGPSLRGRETVVGVAARVGMAGPLTVALDGIELAVDAGAGRATATAFARVRGDAAGEAGAYDGAEVRIELARIDGTWRIARVSPDRTLTR